MFNDKSFFKNQINFFKKLKIFSLFEHWNSLNKKRDLTKKKFDKMVLVRNIIGTLFSMYDVMITIGTLGYVF